LTVRLFLTGKFLPNYVEAVFASRRLPPKAAVSACSRHSFVEGIRNGGLDVLKTAAVLENPLWAHEATCPATVFFFSPLVGAGSLGLFGLFLLLCGCLFQPVKTLIADNVFNPAGVGLRSFGINACGDKLLHKKQMAFIDFLGNLPTYDGQMKEPIIIHGQKTSIFQNAYRMADTRFAKAHVPGKVNGADHALFPLKNQHGL
jgi:hypothetical protein